MIIRAIIRKSFPIQAYSISLAPRKVHFRIALDVYELLDEMRLETDFMINIKELEVSIRREGSLQNI